MIRSFQLFRENTDEISMTHHLKAFVYALIKLDDADLGTILSVVEVASRFYQDRDIYLLAQALMRTTQSARFLRVYYLMEQLNLDEIHELYTAIQRFVSQARDENLMMELIFDDDKDPFEMQELYEMASERGMGTKSFNREERAKMRETQD